MILRRTKHLDNYAIIENKAEEFKISLIKVEWLLPDIRVTDHNKIPLLNLIKADKTLTLPFRTWTMCEYPTPCSVQHRHVWSVKTSSALRKPRFVILGFQTNRQNKKDQNASHFDHAKLRDVKLYLNSQCYPYANVNLDITNNQFALLYDMYSHFQSEYYSKEAEPLLSRSEFLNYAPLAIINCSTQNELLKTGTVDVRLEFKLYENFPLEQQLKV